MKRAKQRITLLFAVLIALFCAACGPSAEAAPEVDPKCFIGETEGQRVEGANDDGQTVHWCCTLWCFNLNEMSCPQGEQLTQFVPAPVSPDAVEGCEQANADGSSWCCKRGSAQ